MGTVGFLLAACSHCSGLAGGPVPCHEPPGAADPKMNEDWKGRAGKSWCGSRWIVRWCEWWGHAALKQSHRGHAKAPACVFSVCSSPLCVCCMCAWEIPPCIPDRASPSWDDDFSCELTSFPAKMCGSFQSRCCRAVLGPRALLCHLCYSSWAVCLLKASEAQISCVLLSWGLYW